MRLLIFFNVCCLFFVFCFNTIAEDSFFYFPHKLDLFKTLREPSLYSGSNDIVNTFLEDRFLDIDSISVQPFLDMAISDDYKTTIFFSGGDVDVFWFVVNYTADNTILSAIRFKPRISKNKGGVSVSLSTLLSISDSRVFYFEDNKITKYLLSDTGIFTLDTSLVVDSSWELALIDDMFPTLTSLYLVLPFSTSTVVSTINNLIANLNLKVFGIAGDDVVFEADNYVDLNHQSGLTSNCSNLHYLFLDLNTSDQVNKLSQVASACSSIEKVFFLILDLKDNTHNLDVINLFPDKRIFYEL